MGQVVGLIRTRWEELQIKKYFQFHGKSREFLFPFPNRVVHFRAKCSILMEDPQNNISGRKR